MSAAVSISDSPNVRLCRGMVVELVECQERSGLKLKQAWQVVARELGLNTRRVRSYWHDEVTTVSADEKDTILARRDAMLEAHIRRLDHEAAILRARLSECRA